MIKTNNVHYALLFMVVLYMLPYLVSPVFGAIVEAEIQTPGDEPYRIISGVQPDEYWIATQYSGLIMLEEVGDDSWIYSIYNLEKSIYDIAGPDPNGYLYCSYYGSISGSGVLVFDCSQKEIIEDIEIGQDYPLRSMVLSPDDSKLYVIGRNWPRVGQYTGGWVEAASHPNEGLLWEIDTSTYEVSNDIGVIGVLPETIYYVEESEWDKLLIYTHERVGVGREVGELIDIITVARDFPREGGLPACFTVDDYPYCNDMVKWSETEPLVALCNRSVAPGIELVSDPKYTHGLWIINTEINEVVETYNIIDSEGYLRGVKHACVSQVNPGIAYLSEGFGGTVAEIAVFDMGTGQIIDYIRTGLVFTPEFIYEIPDGRLIVSGGLTENIVIIDPTE